MRDERIKWDEVQDHLIIIQRNINNNLGITLAQNDRTGLEKNPYSWAIDLYVSKWLHLSGMSHLTL